MAEDRYSINAVNRSFQVLDLMTKKNGPISVQEASESLSVNVNMAFRLLRSLEETGYVEHDEKTGLYRLSIKVLKLSVTALQGLEIRKFAMPYMEILWSQFPKANVNMGMRSGDEIMMLDRIDGNQLPRTNFAPGKLIPFHCSGLGKVLLSDLPEEEVRAMIERTGGLKAYTAETITDVDLFIETLRAVKEEGVGRDRGEFILGDNCSAVPVKNAEGKIVAAISTSALEPNMTREEIEATIPKLKETANRVSGMLGYISL